MSSQQRKGPRDTAAYVLAATAANVRSFLYNLAEGTTPYRSLHSLTEQVEHQYHGRFLVELIQNAHDQLEDLSVDADRPARIAITIGDDSDHGTLYVANDGHPFTDSNFKSLSNLGQSDKDPEASIGHKGIGFRSVLEITDSPEVYSRYSPNSPGFDGFCFAFSPEIIRQLYLPIVALVNGDDSTVLPFSTTPLVDWDAKTIGKLRSSVRGRAETAGLTPEQWLTKELAFLSPYMLPLPTRDPDRHAHVRTMAQEGFASVIRLPLISAAARATVREKLAALREDDILFLQRLSCLVLDSGDRRRLLNRRRVPRRQSVHRGAKVAITADGAETARQYWVWQRELEIGDAPQSVRDAVIRLPGKWPEVRHVTVSIGVPVVDTPESGTLSIFLPTPLETGCSAHVNAPFFGDMSRTHVDFGKGEAGVEAPSTLYNDFLLGQAADLAVSVITDELAGHSVGEACAIVDLLAPNGLRADAPERWKRLIGVAVEARKLELPSAQWCLTDHGWKSLAETSLLPTVDGAEILTPSVLRKHVTFPAHVSGLDSRAPWIERLSSAHEIPAFPSHADLADTIERVAGTLNRSIDTDWDAFWRETKAILDDDCSHLAGKSVLLGNDGELHASGGQCAIFFVPRQGIGDEEELASESDLREIPKSLKPYVAFLSDRIQQYEEKGGRLLQTPIRKHLEETELVARFRREDILNDVLIRRTPPLPAPAYGSATRLCRDILSWGLRLTANVADRGKGERLLQLLRRLPAPCLGGWFQLGEASFGPGWPGTKGDVADAYLRRVDTPESRTARERLLVPPEHESWGGDGLTYLTLLRQIGVFDGVKLLDAEAGPWSTGFEAFKSYFLLPERGPCGWSPPDWAQYRDVVRGDARPSYNKGKYEVQRLRVLPGLDKYASFDEDTRAAFVQAVFASAGQWPHSWWTVTVRRTEGNADSFTVTSPLAWKLRGLHWISIKSGDREVWCRPAECWHVPAHELAGNRSGQFVHLRPLPPGLANLLDRQETLAESMRQLGMPRFDLEAPSADTRLLEALVHSVEASEVRNWDILLGQVRGAWGAFEPSFGNRFPSRLLVHDASDRLTVQAPDANSPVYLPDTKKAFVAELRRFHRPVVAIEPVDATRLAENFVAAYGQGVVRAATLKSTPLVDKQRWTEGSLERLQDHERLDWLIPVMLTIVANHGPEAQGAGARSFRRYVARLHDARVAIRRSIQLALYEGDRTLGEPISVPALWHGETQTLLLRDPSETDVAEISEALASLLERDDMEVPLRLVLRITGWDPTQVEIFRGLAELKLDESHYRTVREHWRGDLSLVIENLVPLISIMKPGIDIGPLLSCDTEEALISLLDELRDERLNGKELIAMARATSDMFEFGSRAYERFGSAVQLASWNTALTSRGAPPLENKEAAAEFRRHLDSAAPVLRSLVAWLIAKDPEIGAFDDLSSRLHATACPATFKTDLWSVDFKAALSQLVPIVGDWRASEDVILALQRAATPEELKNLLGGLGVNAGGDPIEVSRDNRERLRTALSRLQQLGLAWAIESDAPNPADWENRVEGYLEELRSRTEVTVLTSVWSDQEVWTLLQGLPADAASAAFWTAVQQASGLEDLVTKLRLSAAAINGADERLASMQEAARRRHRVVSVCGREFDNSDDNLRSLWSHIGKALPDDSLGDLSAIDLGSVAKLATIETHSKRRKDGEPRIPSGQKHRPLSKAMEQLVGLSGEIHAYRMLQHSYGKDVVHAGCWIAGNSARIGLNAPDNTDDGFGCDFVIVHQGRTYYIEAKSSALDDSSFTLTSSEIRLAKEVLKRSRKRRKEVFHVLCVANALTATPSFRLLPNPYDPQFRSLFQIDDADARVRYRETR